jgi:uncharacterized protein (TIGR02996 family)
MLDDPFLTAVLAAPDDDATRLVYADWLEERGDPRAEFLRVESQFLKLAPNAKRASALQARLRELQPVLDPDWVALVRRTPVRDAIEAALEGLEALLPGLNYVVSLGIYRVARQADATPEAYVRTALGPEVVLGGTLRTVTGVELLKEVEGCLRYAGDRGHGPDPSALRSPELNRLVRQVLDYLGRSAEEATTVGAFWLREGHPFYPVMWDFGYVLVKRYCAVVFLGSSSD